MSRRWIVSVISVTGIWLSVGSRPVLACQGTFAVTSCTATCSTNCYLNTDLNCSDGQGITLNSGAKLDLCGHTMNCTSPLWGTKAGVTMTASSSQVVNTTSGPPNNLPGKFTGGWNPAVKCNAYTATKVLGIRFQSGVYRAATDCAKFQQNVLLDADVYSGGVASTDEISDNYISTSSYGITIASPYSGSIHNNFIAGNFYDGIDVNGAFGASASDNIILGNQSSSVPIYDGPGGAVTYSNNYCDPLNSNCASCISSGYCTSAQVPFTLP